MHKVMGFSLDPRMGFACRITLRFFIMTWCYEWLTKTCTAGLSAKDMWRRSPRRISELMLQRVRAAGVHGGVNACMTVERALNVHWIIIVLWMTLLYRCLTISCCRLYQSYYALCRWMQTNIGRGRSRISEKARGKLCAAIAGNWVRISSKLEIMSFLVDITILPILPPHKTWKGT